MPELVGEDAAATVFAWIIEDLMTLRFWQNPPVGTSMHDAFLARREQRSSEDDADYLRALSESAPGLYEVQAADAGEGLAMRKATDEQIDEILRGQVDAVTAPPLTTVWLVDVLRSLEA